MNGLDVKYTVQRLHHSTVHTVELHAVASLQQTQVTENGELNNVKRIQ